MKPDLPETANRADKGDDGRLFAPHSPRIKGPILDLLQARLGKSGRFLEIASGTGENTVHYAAGLPDWRFQPTDVDPERIASIGAWIAHSGADNIAAPVELNAADPGWGITVEVDVIHIGNLFHLISQAQTKAILNECAQALAPAGQLIIYGPFMRAGALTSEGDARFHQNLTAHNPEIGYKDDFDMLEWITQAGLEPAEVIEMPANNLCLIARRSF